MQVYVQSPNCAQLTTLYDQSQGKQIGLLTLRPVRFYRKFSRDFFEKKNSAKIFQLRDQSQGKQKASIWLSDVRIRIQLRDQSQGKQKASIWLSDVTIVTIRIQLRDVFFGVFRFVRGFFFSFFSALSAFFGVVLEDLQRQYLLKHNM
jgi:hypothetical protein